MDYNTDDGFFPEPIHQLDAAGTNTSNAISYLFHGFNKAINCLKSNKYENFRSPS